MRTYPSGYRRDELEMRCKDLENRGWRCVTPIQKIDRYGKNYTANTNKKNSKAKRSFKEYYQEALYRACYEKV